MLNYKQIFGSLVLVLTFNICLIGQNPYELNLKKDLILFGGGALGQVTTIILSAEIDDFTDQEIGLLNSNNINRFDRRATGFYSLRSLEYSDVLLTGSYFFPALFLANKKSRDGFLEIGVLGMEAFLLNATLTSLTKISVQRTRPLAYNPNVPMDKRKSKSAKFSFFSGHTSAVSVLSFFSAKVYSDYFPDSKWKPVVWTTAAIIPAATAYFRVKGGKHFPTDVIMGYAFGAVVGYVIPQIHKKKDKDQKVTFSILTGVDAVGVNLTW